MANDPNKDREQINSLIPKYLTRNARQDAMDFNVPVDTVVTVALQNLFCLKKVERSLMYRRLPKKRAGRPIKNKE